ncbi:hypothetical protein R4Z10_10955 [Niallia sp. XMNu-256]|uniref:hypothetical protein n=1 Tax=Niallia sp. XMNu-256 TaxID=3082444 RepID=UPI0030D35486
MTSNTIRSFALGILIASGVLGAVYFLEPKEAGSNETKEAKTVVETPSADEMKNHLAKEGYLVRTEAEWNDQLAAAKAEQSENQAAPTEEKVIYRTMISVSSGMTSIDVGRALEKTNIIENAFAFSKEVEKRGVSNGLRPGMYEVSSEMSLDEIISTIFK